MLRGLQDLPQPGMEPVSPLQWKHRVLTIGLPEKSWMLFNETRYSVMLSVRFLAVIIYSACMAASSAAACEGKAWTLKLDGLEPWPRLCRLPAVTSGVVPGTSPVLGQPHGCEEQMYVDCLAWLPAHNICVINVNYLLNDWVSEWILLLWILSRVSERDVILSADWFLWLNWTCLAMDRKFVSFNSQVTFWIYSRNL